MPTIRSKTSWIILTSALVLITASALMRPMDQTSHVSMMDVKRIAEANGFFAAAFEIEMGDEAECFQKLIISRRELSNSDLNSLTMGNMEHPSWRDCVCLMRARRDNDVGHLSPLPDEIIGDLLFFGDTHVIKSIRTLLAADSRLK